MASKCTLNLVYGVELRLWISNYVGSLILGPSGFQTSGRVYPTLRWERPLVWLKFLGLLKLIFYYILIGLLYCFFPNFLPYCVILLYFILLNSLGFALRILCLKNVLGIAERIHK